MDLYIIYNNVHIDVDITLSTSLYTNEDEIIITLKYLIDIYKSITILRELPYMELLKNNYVNILINMINNDKYDIEFFKETNEFILIFDININNIIIHHKFICLLDENYALKDEVLSLKSHICEHDNEINLLNNYADNTINELEELKNQYKKQQQQLLTLLDKQNNNIYQLQQQIIKQEEVIKIIKLDILNLTEKYDYDFNIIKRNFKIITSYFEQKYNNTINHIRNDILPHVRDNAIQVTNVLHEILYITNLHKNDNIQRRMLSSRNICNITKK